MRSVVVLIVLTIIVFGSCRGDRAVEMVFEAPDETMAFTFRFERDKRIGLFVSDLNGKNDHLHRVISGSGLSRVWVGWSRDSRTAAILACDEESVQPMFYQNVSRQEVLSPDREASRVAEAVANLNKSLERLASGSSQKQSREYAKTVGAVSWYCSVGDLREFEAVNRSTFLSYRVPRSMFQGLY